jgi:hypothetical protein
MTDNIKKKYFDKEKQQEALKILNSKWVKDKDCEICGKSNWTIAEDLVMPMPFTGGGLVIGGPSYPQLQVICGNCGNTKYFNAVILGVARSEQKKNGEEDGK